MSQLHEFRNPPRADVAATPDLDATSQAFWLDGPSTSVLQLRGQIRRVAPYFRTALLVGEPDCAEQAAARLLHQLSPLSHRPFVDLLSKTATERFADTGPDEVACSTGMFFISRPEMLSQTIQLSLLRLLRKQGANAPRIVAFAGRSLRPLVSAAGFSAELAEHLGSLRIVIPPLRERREDIPQLLTYLLDSMAAQSGVPVPEVAPDLMESARLLPWRGNLPQLHSAAAGLLKRATHLVLHAPDLDAVLGDLSAPPAPYHREVRMIRLDDVIQEHVRSVLYACNGNKLRSAEVLGISRSTLYRMLEIPTRIAPQILTSTDGQMTC